MLQISLLDKRLSITHQISKESVAQRTYKERIKVGRERPASLGYFTIGQLLYILTYIQQNYLAEYHVFHFNKETFIVRIISDEVSEQSETIPTTDQTKPSKDRPEPIHPLPS